MLPRWLEHRNATPGRKSFTQSKAKRLDQDVLDRSVALPLDQKNQTLKQS